MSLTNTEAYRVKSYALSRWSANPFKPASDVALDLTQLIKGIRIQGSPERASIDDQIVYADVLAITAAARAEFLAARKKRGLSKLAELRLLETRI